ncbi:hypothetical protein RFI_01015 [Reticulomyxa filosa]|uniref:Uncharacterized protein n=1 Tax=Reticulomyxa filosa TaxID=46433 RepID=X6PDA9_RETFI|nr:hypothetical protein RFI_01015 [Reticulomyxa filosa]|eukprot:ETO36044.1 hypothetical protein RFI_01015 [Reticulomyxa filosa]
MFPDYPQLPVSEELKYLGKFQVHPQLLPQNVGEEEKKKQQQKLALNDFRPPKPRQIINFFDGPNTHNFHCFFRISATCNEREKNIILDKNPFEMSNFKKCGPFEIALSFRLYCAQMSLLIITGKKKDNALCH